MAAVCQFSLLCNIPTHDEAAGSFSVLPSVIIPSVSSSAITSKAATNILVTVTGYTCVRGRKSEP